MSMKYTHNIAIFCALCAVFFSLVVTHAQAQTANPTGAAPKEYAPLSPLPKTTPCGDNIPSGAQGGSSCKTTLATYLPGVFKFSIGIAGVLAVIMIVIGGIQYLSTDAWYGKEEGKTKIKQAIGGLALAIAAWFVLNAINPNLLKINANLPTVQPSQTTSTP